MLARTVLAALLVLVPVAAKSQGQNTGKRFYQACKNVLDDSNIRDVFLQGVCQGTINAIYYYGEVLPKRDRFCSPPGSDARQAAQIVASYMEANPGVLHKSIFSIAEEALRKKWPCPSR